MGNTLQKSPQFPPPHQQEQPPLQQQQELQEQSQQQQQQHQQQHEVESNEENGDFTCEICIEPAPNSDKRFRNSGKCVHPFCTDCVIKYIRVELDDNNAGRIKCPAVGCHHLLDPLDCAAVVGPVLFVRWCDVLCESAIVELEKCYCPNLSCNVLIVNECGGAAKKSKCPNCDNFFCFECKSAWHAGFACEESAEPRDRNDVAFGRLVEQQMWKRCPRCRHFVELKEGCPIIRCRCGSSFCYRCEVLVDRPWCRCMTSSLRRCRVCCCRVCILMIFLTVALFFLVWGVDKHKR